MSDNIYEAAKKFQKLMNYEYMLVFGRNWKNSDIPIRFDKQNFYHLCGLHKLKDIFASDQNQNEVFNNIIKGKITDNYLSQSKFYIEKNVEDRIKRVVNITNLLEKTLCQPGTFEVFKYNRNANPESNINGDFLIKYTEQDKRTVYFILREDSSNRGKYFGLSIFSRDLSDTRQRDYAEGHTRNTLVYVSKTPLTADKQLDKKKENVLYQLSPNSDPGDSNINIMKFTPITNVPGDSVALTTPRFTFGQALTNLINRWAEKIGEGIERRRQELKSAKEEIVELKQALSERDEQLAQKDEQLNAKDNEIVGLQKQNVALMADLKEKIKLIRAANSPKTLSQKMNDATKRSRDKKAAVQPRPKPTDHNPTR